MKRLRKSGSAMVVALLLALLASGTAMVVLTYASHSASLTRRSLDYQRARIVAEAGLDYGRTKLVDIMRQYQFLLSDAQVDGLTSAVASPPPLGTYYYQTPNGTAALRIRREGAIQTGAIPAGSVAQGSDGQYQYFTITSGAINPQSGVGAVLTERVMALSVFLMRFGVFYEDDLEILPGPAMTFAGWVHGNSDIYVGGPLTFEDKLTATESIYHHRKDNNSAPGEVFIKNDAGQLISMKQHGDVVDSNYSGWMVEALDLWDGRVKSEAHAVPHLAAPINPLDEPHDIIERPILPSYPGYHKETEDEKMANKAALTIHVDAAGGVTVTDHYGVDVTDRFDEAVPKQVGTHNGKPVYEKDGDGAYELDTEGAYDTTETFYDGREHATMAPVDIYIDQVVDAFPELYSGTTYGVSEGRGVVYVTRDDPDGTGGKIPAVRLRNGQALPDGGLTFASDLPVYIEGDFNTSGQEPAMVTGDAVTMLSTAWQDAHSSEGIGHRVAASTEYHAVIMTGNSPTIPGVQYNGGLENVLRFQERWSGKTVKFRGSIIDLWSSETATGPWHYGQYYTAPRRDWGYDPIYLTEAPPGIPRVFGLEQISWAETTWSEAGL